MVKSLLKITVKLKSQMIQNIKNTVGKILTPLIQLFQYFSTMFPTVVNKDSSDFLSDYYFNTKSPVAFTSPLALYGEAKQCYLSLNFRQVKTW